MSELNLLEKRLCSWRLRCPSTELKERLIAEPVRFTTKMAWFASWLVPASACVFLTFSVFTSGNDWSRCSSPGAAPLRHPIHLASLPDNFRPGQNNLVSITFDLTNCGGAASTISAFQQSLTN